MYDLPFYSECIHFTNIRAKLKKYMTDGLLPDTTTPVEEAYLLLVESYNLDSFKKYYGKRSIPSYTIELMISNTLRRSLQDAKIDDMVIEKIMTTPEKVRALTNHLVVERKYYSNILREPLTEMSEVLPFATKNVREVINKIRATVIAEMLKDFYHVGYVNNGYLLKMAENFLLVYVERNFLELVNIVEKYSLKKTLTVVANLITVMYRANRHTHDIGESVGKVWYNQCIEMIHLDLRDQAIKYGKYSNQLSEFKMLHRFFKIHKMITILVGRQAACTRISSHVALNNILTSLDLTINDFIDYLQQGRVYGYVFTVEAREASIDRQTRSVSINRIMTANDCKKLIYKFEYEFKKKQKK